MKLSQYGGIEEPATAPARPYKAYAAATALVLGSASALGLATTGLSSAVFAAKAAAPAPRLRVAASSDAL